MNLSPLAAALLLAGLPALLNAQQALPPAPAESVEVRPALIDSSCQAPTHPDSLRRAGIEGRVVLAFVVDTNGAVEANTVRVLTTTHLLFEGPARAAIATCRYRPGRREGHVVRVLMRQPVNFTLPERRPE
jgi:TonB family protein